MRKDNLNVFHLIYIYVWWVKCWGQGWELAHLLIAHLLICSNCLGQISKCGQFAQVAQDKWATVRNTLRLLMTNEQMWAICSGRSGQISEWANRSFSLLLTKKWAISSKKFRKNRIFVRFLLFFKKTKDLLIPSERSEQIAQVAQDKWATVSDSLRSLRRNEWL